MSPVIYFQQIKSPLTHTAFSSLIAQTDLFVLSSGKATILNENNDLEIHAPCVISIPSQSDARIVYEAGSRGRVLSIPDTQLGQSIPFGSIENNVRQAMRTRIVAQNLTESVPFKKALSLMNEIEDETEGSEHGARTAAQLYLTLLLVQVWRVSQPETTRTVIGPRRIAQEFLNLVEVQLTNHWTIGQYANHLGVSKDHLNTVVRRTTKTSPLGFLQMRLIQEAENLLTHSDLQVAEVAYRLGFRDPAYFNRFFQRHRNIAPGQFRAKQTRKALLKLTEESFASWP